MKQYGSLRSRAYRATWAALALLLLQQGVDAFIQQAPWLIWLIKLLPLLMFLPGMRRDNLRSYIWLCFICLGYFMLLVQRIFATPTDPVVITGLIAVVLLFTAAMLYVRWRARELRDLQGQSRVSGV